MELLGLNTQAGRKKIQNKRYRLKDLRNKNYPKFFQLCQQHRVPCPEHNNWIFSLPNDQDESDVSIEHDKPDYITINTPDHLDKYKFKSPMKTVTKYIPPGDGEDRGKLIGGLAPHNLTNSHSHVFY
jgi:hypothetical protein